MKLLGVSLVAAVLFTGCSGMGSPPTSPSFTYPTPGVNLPLKPNRWDDAAWPNPPSDITWPDPSGPGNPGFTHVTITNKSGQVQDFTMGVFDASNGGDHETQRLIRAVTRRFQVGETATFGFDMSDECGSLYQRDIWESSQVGVGRLYAEGGPSLRGRCNSDPPPPPPQLCRDESALNYGKPLPCTYYFPPPPIDLCPNLEGIQTFLSDGYHYENGLCIENPPPQCNEHSEHNGPQHVNPPPCEEHNGGGRGNENHHPR